MTPTGQQPSLPVDCGFYQAPWAGIPVLLKKPFSEPEQMLLSEQAHLKGLFFTEIKNLCRAKCVAWHITSSEKGQR